jgi:HD superfamily phosphohydrolase
MSSQFKSHTVINDPIYGFVSIRGKLIFNLLNHRYFQRLRRISQLGLTYLVYPGARHTRFEHALGAMHLTHLALQSLISKGVSITEEEQESTLVAILLHDVGHGPFSHTLEKTIIPGVHHEKISLILMDLLNQEYDQKLTKAIQIFKDEYPKKFLHQLVSSQLDMDRMDYLNRDSFLFGSNRRYCELRSHYQ